MKKNKKAEPEAAVLNPVDENVICTGAYYPCGPCSLPLKCGTCGTIITEENVIMEDCEDECEVCDYCGNEKCPSCGEHWHCGGCI